MKKWYREYLYMAKEEKISEKTFLRRITVMVVGMLLCLFSMGFTAYAYFSCSITSGVSTLQSATYDVDVYAENIGAGTRPVLIDDTSTLGVGSYRITIQASGTATTGYSKVLIGGNEYFTGSMSPGSSLSFEIKCNESTNVSVIANWGTYSGESNLKADLLITIGKETSSISEEEEAEANEEQEASDSQEQEDSDSQEQVDSDSQEQEDSDSQEQESPDSEEQEASNDEKLELPGTDEEVDGADSTEQGAEQETESSVTQNE